jgi:hypothetical protein
MQQEAEFEQKMFKIAEDAYFKAAESSDPQHWMEAALFAKQHRNALVKLRAINNKG